MTESTKKRTRVNLSQTMTRPRKNKCPRPSRSFFYVSSLSNTSKGQDQEAESSMKESTKKRTKENLSHQPEEEEVSTSFSLFLLSLITIKHQQGARSGSRILHDGVDKEANQRESVSLARGRRSVRVLLALSFLSHHYQTQARNKTHFKRNRILHQRIDKEAEKRGH
ncbi:hypothetical protein AMTRI_Chr13g122490 [Amborella trichopoda]